MNFALLSYTIAREYASPGEKDKIFESLEKAYEQRNPSMYLLKAGAYFDNLRGDPRFTALLKKIGLEK